MNSDNIDILMPITSALMQTDTSTINLDDIKYVNALGSAINGNRFDLVCICLPKCALE